MTPIEVTITVSLPPRITPRERELLVRVRDHLRSGEVRPLPSDSLHSRPSRHHWPDWGEEPRPEWFSMSNFRSFRDCGTAMCIGGWMSHFAGEPVHRACSDDLQRLFMPSTPDWRRITPTIAAEAIDRFLEFGNPGWAELVS